MSYNNPDEWDNGPGYYSERVSPSRTPLGIARDATRRAFTRNIIGVTYQYTENAIGEKGEPKPVFCRYFRGRIVQRNNNPFQWGGQPAVEYDMLMALDWDANLAGCDAYYDFEIDPPHYLEPVANNLGRGDRLSTLVYCREARGNA